MTLKATPRSFLSAFLDRSVAWFMGLPEETCTYVLTRHLHITMRDGINLMADLYMPQLPLDAGSAPLLLVQGCYGRGLIMCLMNVRLYAARGYAVLFVSCRGTFGSGGHFLPGHGEQHDGQDIVCWMRQQSWYPGSFATIGASYLGYSQWALLHDPPADWIGAVIPVAPHDYANAHWGTGALLLDTIIWADTVSHQEEGSSGFVPRLPSSPLRKNAALGRTIFLSLPLRESVQTYLAGNAPWVSKFLTHSDPEDSFWEPTHHGVALDRVNKPIFLISGWYDLYIGPVMEQYCRLRDRGCPVALTIGPWSHLGASGLKSMPEILEFLDEHVAGRKKSSRPQPVRIFVMGINEWRFLPNWPPSSKPCVFYLNNDNSLKREAYPLDVESSSFIFDPADPTPTIGGPLLRGGRVDDGVYASRSDVLVSTSSPLETDIEIIGSPVVELAHSSDTPYVDLWVRLSEISLTGVSHNITEQFLSLNPSRNQSEIVRLNMQSCAHRFRKGTRIRLIVAGGSFPQYARSLGKEGNRALGSEMLPAKHTIQHTAGRSRLILPATE